MSKGKPRARLIIPLWGEIYASKLATITLPALLASGNLPALCQNFSVEFIIVTETKLFNWIRQSNSYQRASALCDIRLVPIDDLLTDTPGDYGVVLTWALYRGFSDLGEKMTETYLIFLNADFIISDGSLRHLGELMMRGERVIHAPSFRAVLEDVWPVLESCVNENTMTLAMPSREMVALALAHKHITVRARTVNQRLCHQWRMDQFYWYVDEHTLIGYQWPVALVAIKPERVTLEPSMVWDYGFVPDAAPNAKRHFISDSDNFFMLEPQKRATGDGLVRLGWISPAAVAADLSKWTTKDHRACGRELLKIHSEDLPNILPIVAESRAYMDDIYSRLSRTPVPHDNHSLLGAWFKSARTRMRGQLNPQPEAAGETAGPPRMSYRSAFRGLYNALFGTVPHVKSNHPLWVDTRAGAQKIAGWRNNKSVLWLSSSDTLFYRLMPNRIDPAALRVANRTALNLGDDQYDACFCDLTVDELPTLRDLYGQIRPLVKHGGEICVYVYNKHLRVLRDSDLVFCEMALPDLDTSSIHFYGSQSAARLRSIFLWAANSFPNSLLMRDLMSGVVLFALTPFTILSNIKSRSRDDTVLPSMWTSLMINFRVEKVGH